ncbi:MAG: SusC/RagA family TonB-linked outer membrane protein [Candidatus Pseudobacter hemicellulosilyticus]|uniref:SusC/RagA family TonB-linked outer membrane protein n=1 Tax=Candidatus Pseudobacter hemicellulosilyticus TaxID=3121375 RepID=A0AAJ5WVM6_9BACT|nr:MAG: SusC/RagA family TonB-linked outer membrane protein [Pseudobacter sp.]
MKKTFVAWVKWTVHNMSVLFILFALFSSFVNEPEISSLADKYFLQTITLSEKEAPLSFIIEKIKQQSGYSFWYTNEAMSAAKPVTIKVNNMPLEEVLRLVFEGQPLVYQIVEQVVVVKRAEKKSPLNTLEDLFAVAEGKVLDEKGNPLTGVSVLVKGTAIGTQTNSSGEFYLNNIPKVAVLVFSIIGFETRAIPADPRPMQVQLRMVVSQLDQMQVIAYGTTSKRFNTGNVTTIKSDVIEDQPVNNPLLALQGRVPGMQIVQATGLPGSGVSVQIRGQNSIRMGNNPLFIVDGVPYPGENVNTAIGVVLGNSGGSPGSPFSFLNPSDIESIDVLKDADATAIYGSRGANGVVLITTKKGKAGDLAVDVTAQHGFGRISKKLDLLSRRQYLDMRNEAFKNDGATPDPKADYDLVLWDTARETDWQKELLGNASQYSDVQASLYGGNQLAQFRLATGFHKETSVFPGDMNNRKGTLGLNVNASSKNNKFKIGYRGVCMVDDNRISGFNLLQQALLLPPVAPRLYNTDGSINWEPNATGVSTWPFSQPAAMIRRQASIKSSSLVNNATLQYELLDGLTISSSFGITYLQAKSVVLSPHSLIDPSSWPSVPRSSGFSDNTSSSWQIEPQVNYIRQWNNMTLSCLAGFTIQQSTINARTISANDFSSDLVLEDPSYAINVASSLKYTKYKYLAAFGRLNYNLNDEFLVNITARRDGSSRFGPASRFHNFGAVGAAWIFSKTDLLKDLYPVFSFGKIRFSYGTTGNDQVGDYSFMDLYEAIPVGVAYQGAIGLRPSRIFTPELQWEETRKFELGLDLGFFKDRLLLGVAYYQNRSSNQILDYKLPSVTGFSAVQRNLNALVQNTGLEIECRTVNVNNPSIKWQSSINLTINRNRLMNRYSEGLSAFFQRLIGHPLATQLAYRFLGVDPVRGLYEVADYEGKPTSSPVASRDQNNLLDPTPVFYGGIQNSISWKGIDIEFLFQFARKPRALGLLYNFYVPGLFSNLTGSNQAEVVMNRWKTPGDVTRIQKFSQNSEVITAWGAARESDWAYSDASFIRLKNLSVSWRIPREWQQRLSLRNARAFIQGQNLLTFSNYDGLDPDSPFFTLPPLRVITIGLQMVISGANSGK